MRNRNEHEEKIRSGRPLEGAATYIDIAHGDARHDCRYVALYLRSSEGIVETQREEGVVESVVDEVQGDREGHCLKIGAARQLRQDFSPNGASLDLVHASSLEMLFIQRSDVGQHVLLVPNHPVGGTPFRLKYMFC
jgi:hypothetical protein